jgi:hypothetical protein
MRLINNVLRRHVGKCVVIYIDDILLFHKYWEKHVQYVCNVLDILWAHKLQVKENNSYFG